MVRRHRLDVLSKHLCLGTSTSNQPIIIEPLPPGVQVHSLDATFGARVVGAGARGELGGRNALCDICINPPLRRHGAEHEQQVTDSAPHHRSLLFFGIDDR